MDPGSQNIFDIIGVALVGFGIVILAILISYQVPIHTYSHKHVMHTWTYIRKGHESGQRARARVAFEHTHKRRADVNLRPINVGAPYRPAIRQVPQDENERRQRREAHVVEMVIPYESAEEAKSACDDHGRMHSFVHR